MQHESVRILIVDDVQDNLAALEAVLRQDKLTIDFATSASQALEMMLVHRYALALLDVQMPETDGFELAELMRGAERTRDIPIMFLTAADRDERRRFRGYEAGAVDFIFKPLDPLILKSKAGVFIRLGEQAQALERQRDELRVLADHRDRAIRRLKAHADNSPVALVEVDCSLRVESWSQGAERLFGIGADQISGLGIADQHWMTADAMALLSQWVQIGAASPQHQAVIELVGAGGTAIQCEVYGSVLVEPSGKLSLSLQLLDITERARAEKLRSLLVGELNHRIKNTLANVQAIARQTLRQSDSLSEFGSSFQGRLQVLARAHSVLSDMTWESASLNQLIDEQVRLGTLDPNRLDCRGPNVQLSPEGALRIALSLHELGTNATKYGALATPFGRISIEWQMRDGLMQLIWRETGGPVVSAPDHEGFGTRLINASAGGESESVGVEWLPSGAVWTIRLPMEDIHSHHSKAVGGEACDTYEPTLRDITGSHILVVEDEPLVALDIREELKGAGAKAINIAYSVSQALEQVQSAHFDIALLDGNLAGEKVDAIAEALQGRGIPFCFVSGYGREHLPLAFSEIPLVEKPFRSEALIPILSDLISRQA